MRGRPKIIKIIMILQSGGEWIMCCWFRKWSWSGSRQTAIQAVLTTWHYCRLGLALLANRYILVILSTLQRQTCCCHLVTAGWNTSTSLAYIVWSGCGVMPGLCYESLSLISTRDKNWRSILVAIFPICLVRFNGCSACTAAYIMQPKSQ